jgi:hypothetical protein
VGVHLPDGSSDGRDGRTEQLRILDHWVTTADGDVFYNPMRVIETEGGSEVVFTLRRQPDMTDDAFEADAIAIVTDLATLKGILEA